MQVGPQISNILNVMVNGMVIISVYKDRVVSEDINLSNTPHHQLPPKLHAAKNVLHIRISSLTKKSADNIFYFMSQSCVIIAIFISTSLHVTKKKLFLLSRVKNTEISCLYVTIMCNYCKVSDDSPPSRAISHDQSGSC